MNFKPSKNDRPAFGKLTSEYGLTYYGTVIPTELDDYIPVRGMTASPEQIDDNYTTGTVAGYNVQLLQRSHDVYLTDNRRVSRTWTICQADLHIAKLPRMIIGGKDKTTGDESILASAAPLLMISPVSLLYISVRRMFRMCRQSLRQSFRLCCRCILPIRILRLMEISCIHTLLIDQFN